MSGAVAGHRIYIYTCEMEKGNGRRLSGVFIKERQEVVDTAALTDFRAALERQKHN